MTEDATQDPFADKRAWWEFLQSSLIGASGELRTVLPVDELSFLRVAGFSHADARAFFIYRALDEIQKAGIAVGQWVELLGPDQDFDGISTIDQIDRVILDSILDDQSLRMRKLVETLVTLVNFERTNEDVYFRHYLLLADLDELLSEQAERSEFYGAGSRNIEAALTSTKARIADLEDEGLDPNRCWYAAGGHRPGRIFCSLRVQMKAALEICGHAERVAMGFSYGLFSTLSSDIHFSFRGRRGLAAWTEVAEGISRVGVAGLVALVRCQRLLDKVPEGRNQQLREAFDRNSFIPEHVERVTAGSVEVGDFVLAAGDLAEIIDTATSAFGYRSYRVAYLAERPLDDVHDDWFPAFAVRRLYGRSDWMNALDPYIEGGLLSMDDVAYLKELSSDVQQGALRDSLVAAWNAGLRDAMRRSPAPGSPLGNDDAQ